jgi:hypothetical protein
MMACASAPRVSEYRFSQEYFTSRNGLLRYKLPIGWLNATNDSLSSNNTIWLVRSDFAVTLSVKEVVIDAETRREVQRMGLKRIAELMLALASGERGVSVVNPPQLANVGRGAACTYEYMTGHPNDRVHVVLIDTGTVVYEMSMLMTEKASSTADVVLLQEAFVRNLSW